MTRGYYGGGTIGLPTPIGGAGGGLYFDNHGNFYPQFYYGTPGTGASAGYSPDPEGFLTGTSVSGSFGRRPIRTNVGASDSSIGVGIGTPGFGATYGWGPYNLDQLINLLMGITPAMGPQDELTPFQRSLQSANGHIGAPRLLSHSSIRATEILMATEWESGAPARRIRVSVACPWLPVQMTSSIAASESGILLGLLLRQIPQVLRARSTIAMEIGALPRQTLFRFYRILGDRSR